MKFLIDARLPVRLAQQLENAGCDAVHTSGLPQGNRTSDQQIAQIADRDGRVVVTKDRDFRDGHLLRQSSRRLLLVESGNISNNDLLTLFDKSLNEILGALDDSDFVKTRGVIVTAQSARSEADFVCRFFAPAVGVPEDPFTGSAHCTLASWWASQLGTRPSRAEQHSTRGGTATVTLDGDRVRILDKAETVLSGGLHV